MFKFYLAIVMHILTCRVKQHFGNVNCSLCERRFLQVAAEFSNSLSKMILHFLCKYTFCVIINVKLETVCLSTAISTAAPTDSTLTQPYHYPPIPHYHLSTTTHIYHPYLHPPLSSYRHSPQPAPTSTTTHTYHRYHHPL